MSYSPTLGRWIEQDPAGYVNGADRYQSVAGNPINRLDPSGLEIVYAGVNSQISQNRYPRDPVSLQSPAFYSRFIESDRYGGTGVLGAGIIKLMLRGDVSVTELDCHVFEARGTFVPTGTIASTTNHVFLSDEMSKTLEAIGVDVAQVDSAIQVLNEQIDRHERLRADIWMSVYDPAYTLTATGGTAEEAVANLYKARDDLEKGLHQKQQDLYNNTFADRLRAKDKEASDALLALVP